VVNSRAPGFSFENEEFQDFNNLEKSQRRKLRAAISNGLAAKLQIKAQNLLPSEPFCNCNQVLFLINFYNKEIIILLYCVVFYYITIVFYSITLNLKDAKGSQHYCTEDKMVRIHAWCSEIESGGFGSRSICKRHFALNTKSDSSAYWTPVDNSKPNYVIECTHIIIFMIYNIYSDFNLYIGNDTSLLFNSEKKFDSYELEEDNTTIASESTDVSFNKAYLDCPFNFIITIYF
jgi:hypothetical protein